MHGHSGEFITGTLLEDFTEYLIFQVETLLEDWDAAEPKTNEETNFGIPTTDLFARYSFYSKLVHDRTKWEQECNQYVVDFESLLLGQTEKYVDPERMVKTFVQEKFNGEFFRLTQHPYPEDEEGDEPSVGWSILLAKRLFHNICPFRSTKSMN